MEDTRAGEYKKNGRCFVEALREHLAEKESG
jgi:hypothetical protein